MGWKRRTHGSSRQMGLPFYMKQYPKSEARRRAIAQPNRKKRLLTSKIDKTKIFRSSIGHYGGLYVEVPAEHFEYIKAHFPSSEFPRNIRKVSIAEGYGELSPDAESKFHKQFPKSNGIYYIIHFADRSKGLKRFESLVEGSCVIGMPPYMD